MVTTCWAAPPDGGDRVFAPDRVDHPMRRQPDNDIGRAPFLCVILLVALETPLRMAGGGVPRPWMGLWDITVSAIYLAEFLWHGRWHRGATVLCVLTVPPWELLLGPLVPGWVPIFQWMRMAQTPRLTAIHPLVQRRCDRHMLPAAADRVILSGLAGLLIMHWAACAWIVLNSMEGAQSTVISYVDALYWTVVTMASVGYGDIVPDTPVERVFAIFVILTGMAFYGYLIGNLAALLGSLDAAHTRHLEQIEEVLSWLKHRHVPARMCQEVNDYFLAQWENRVALDDAEMLRRLPPSLQAEVAVCLNRQLLERVEFLQNAPAELISALAMRLQQQLFRPGDIIFRHGSIGNHMYFISRGTVEIVGPDGIEVIARLSDGQFFGEMALLSGAQRSASARAASYSVLAVLEKNCFDNTLEHFPNMKDAIEETARRRRELAIERNRPPVSGETL